MTVYVITACHNRRSITKKFIDSIKSQIYKEIHLILVDDGSTDGTAEMVKNEFKNTTIIRGNGNLWWGGALHEAYKWLKKHVKNDRDIVFFSNDDNIYEVGYIAKAVELINNNEHSLIAGCGYSIYNNERFDGVFFWDKKRGAGELLQGTTEGDLASTRSLFVRVKDLLDIGGFHPILLPHYLSDYEFTIRAYRKGYKIKSFDNLIYHSDRLASGVTNYKDITIKVLFSKKCPFNPIYKLNFVLLINPIWCWPVAIFNQLQRFGKQVSKLKNV